MLFFSLLPVPIGQGPTIEPMSESGGGGAPCPAADSWEAVAVTVSPGLLGSSRQTEDCDCLLETEPTFALPGPQPWKPNTVF